MSNEPAPTVHEAPGAEGYRADIEGLRGIAVSLVVAYHATLPGITGGYVGVDVFFVLSGYLITGILARQIERTGHLDILRFYARRVLRLLPAATLVLVAVLIASLIFLGSLEQIDPTASSIAVSLYGGNMFFMLRATDYFAPSSELSPLLHTWSLAVEEQFYFFWPVLVLLGFRFGKSRRGLAILMTVFTVLSFVGSVWLTYKKQAWAFFGTPARAWEFGIGGLASLLGATSLLQLRRVAPILGWLGLMLIFGGAFLLTPQTQFPGWAALLPAVGTTFALIAGASGAGWAGTVMTAPILQWLGKRSYSWYLWHWPVIVFARTLHLADTTVLRMGWMLLALLLAFLTTKFFENPIRFHASFRGRPARTLFAGAACTVAAASISIVLNRQAVAKGGDLYAAAHDLSPITTKGCETDFNQSAPTECVFGDTASAKTIVLFGDSHAAQWFLALNELALRNHFRLVTEIKYSCPVARVQVFNTVLNRDYSECREWRELVFKRLALLKPSFVIVAHASRGSDKSKPKDGVRDTVTYAEWSDGFRSSLQTMDSLGLRTIFIRDTPRMTEASPTCLSRALKEKKGTAHCGRERSSALPEETYRGELAALNAFPNNRAVDFSDNICLPARCEAERDGLVVYRDTGHLTVKYVEHLSPIVERR
ncbi:MAG: acyltransferase family protein, partial [Gemmatimonas sp.]